MKITCNLFHDINRRSENVNPNFFFLSGFYGRTCSMYFILSYILDRENYLMHICNLLKHVVHWKYILFPRNMLCIAENSLNSRPNHIINLTFFSHIDLRIVEHSVFNTMISTSIHLRTTVCYRIQERFRWWKFIAPFLI